MRDLMLDVPASLTPAVAINDVRKQKGKDAVDNVDDVSTTSPGNDHMVPTSKISPVIMLKARNDYYGSVYAIPMYEVWNFTDPTSRELASACHTWKRTSCLRLPPGQYDLRFQVVSCYVAGTVGRCPQALGHQQRQLGCRLTLRMGPNDVHHQGFGQPRALETKAG